MLRLTVEAIGESAREQAEHFCICLGHQDQLIDTFLSLIMRIANGERYVAAHGKLDPGEPELPPRIPGKCRLCEQPMPLPGNLGMCQRCYDQLLSEQLTGMAEGDYQPPPPPTPLGDSDAA